MTRRPTARRRCTSASSCAARASSTSRPMCPPASAPPASIRCCSRPAAYSRNTTSARRRAARTNLAWHSEDRLEMHPHDAEARGIDHGDWVGVTSRAGDTVLRVEITDRVAPGVVYTTFHFPESGANLITTENSDWATNCPGIQGDRGAGREGGAARVVAAAPPGRRAGAHRSDVARSARKHRSAVDRGRRTTGRDGQRHRRILRRRRRQGAWQPKACAFTCRGSGSRACAARSSRTCRRVARASRPRRAPAIELLGLIAQINRQ